MHHVVVHAHCYQPPRENPWLEVVESEPSAAPDHNWNARIDRECYARLAAAEVRRRDPLHPGDPDARAGLARLVNLYAWCTFDVGATLCEWLDTESPETLQAMIAGDAASVRRWGHGNAIAAPYHHVILPLASVRDRRTEVRWGIADFTRRFGRKPEGFWLPECAADDDTLDLLAAEGIRFTILAPYQVRTTGETHGLPVEWQGASGRSLIILPYDGALAGEVAFGGLLRNAPALANRLAPFIDDGQPRCTTLATDGETFGHHHRSGDRTLADAMALVASRPHAVLSNAAGVVATYAPTLRAHLVSPSSWSCAHGVERWRANCGCRINHDNAPAQHWRGPLREALQQVEQLGAHTFKREGTSLFRVPPWEARDRYGEFVASDGHALAQAVYTLLVPDCSDAQIVRARQLLEMQRASLRMFTSCAWFFDEVDRIETRQVLRYAARVMELSQISPTEHATIMAQLARAHAAAPTSPTAADAFQQSVPAHGHHVLQAAAGAIALAVHGTPCSRIAVFDVTVTPPRSVDTPTSDAGAVAGAVTDSGANAPPYFVVTLHHRRTGRIMMRVGQVRGAGPHLQVAVAADAHDLATASYLSIADMPESVSYTLLRTWRLHDDAMRMDPNDGPAASATTPA
jgi:hypothetical protein